MVKMFEITFLGTSSGVPTKERNQPGIFIRYNNLGFLMDCGENIQRQILHSKNITLNKIDIILITHWHGDHVLGIPGILQTSQLNKRKKPLIILGPRGTKENIRKIKELFIYGELPFNLRVYDLPSKEKIIFENKDLRVYSFPTYHTIKSLGYKIEEKEKRRIIKEKIKKIGLYANPIVKNLQEGKDIVWKGKKIKYKDYTEIVPKKVISYLGDTEYNKNLINYIKNSDILISESTFLSDDDIKKKEYKHLTAKEAATLAKEANVKKLILTHFSQRYKDCKLFLREAKNVLKNVICAEDFMIKKL